jgi:hypothetical protein
MEEITLSKKSADKIFSILKYIKYDGMGDKPTYEDVTELVSELRTKLDKHWHDGHSDFEGLGHFMGLYLHKMLDTSNSIPEGWRESLDNLFREKNDAHRKKIVFRRIKDGLYVNEWQYSQGNFEIASYRTNPLDVKGEVEEFAKKNFDLFFKDTHEMVEIRAIEYEEKVL